MRRELRPTYVVGNDTFTKFSEAQRAERERHIENLVADHRPYSPAEVTEFILEHVKPFLHWVHISERVPAPNQTCFVCTPDSQYIGVAHWLFDHWRLDNTTDDFRPEEYEFWAAQPSIPGGE